MFLPRLIKRLARPLGLAALTLTLHSAPACADTFTLTLFPTVQNVTHGPSLFDDHFNFSISSPTDVATSAVNIALKLGGLDVYHISNFEMNFYNSLNPNQPLISGTGNPIDLSLNLGSGNYFANVKGKSDGLAGGSYLFSWATSAAPIPEPAEWALLSIGLVGIMVGTRRKYM